MGGKQRNGMIIKINMMPQRLKKLSDPLGTMSSQPTERIGRA